MFYCNNCGFEFEKPYRLYEKHGMVSPPYELLNVCPDCKSNDFYEKITTHCRCCGARLEKGEVDYCSPKCQEKGERLRKTERRKRKRIVESPLNEIIRQVNAYNIQNNTKYSYGQYVAQILPKMKAESKKCTKKKNTT